MGHTGRPYPDTHKELQECLPTYRPGTVLQGKSRGGLKWGWDPLRPRVDTGSEW